MCGILGLIRRQPIAEPLFRRALNTMAHRGPDDDGVEHLGDVWLGHRRLSILDLSAHGHQPMTDPSRRFWIVFNGEIYNFLEVRRELEQKGFRFVSDCDTEVILRAYEVWGEECLERLNGMFAFAIWDEREKVLFAARDRLGVKPFYYVEMADGVAFASEVKALLQLPGVPREFNAAALPKYLAFLWVPDPDTLFRGVKKLPPGHKLVWRAGQSRIEPWWDVAQIVTSRAPLYAAKRDVARLLGESVRERLISDVPLGVFLSGGLDSSTILAMARQHTRDSIITFTVGFRPQDLALDIIPDDMRYARLMASRSQPLDYNEIELEPSGFEHWPKLVWHLDEPLADPAAISTFLICRAAKRKATVMLMGVGGEELFGGYPRHLATSLAIQYRKAPAVLRGAIGRAVTRMHISRADRMSPRLRNLKKFLRSAHFSFEESYLGFSSYYTPEELQRLLGRRVGYEEVYDQHLGYLRRAAGMELLNRILYLDIKTFLPCLNLAYADKCSMAASVEVREPLLDYRLVERVMALPGRYKVSGSQQKCVYKRAVAPWLPSAIVSRKKAGFSGPVRAWIKKDYRGPIYDMLFGQRFRDRGLVDINAVKAIYDANEQGYEDYALRLWALVTLELWFETFMDRDGAAPLS
ncbi:MAG TPA: asparagine synthase (glutamine-hydrolyzing) [Verrucomicrobiae bacterium]|nr:asparagine synthase (glutamine-hydrolyzing) [Verrucomicrobiae bacterium]